MKTCLALLIAIVASSMIAGIGVAHAQHGTKSATLQGTTTRETLQREFPGATITQRGTNIFEISGLSDADIAKLGSVAGVQRVAVLGQLTPEKRRAIEAFGGLMTHFDGETRGGLTGGRRGRIVCDDCGLYPGPVGKNCGDLRDKKQAAAEANAAAQEFLDMLQALLQAYKEWAFWGGVAGMLGDMASAASAVLTAGGATPAVNAAAKILLDMGQNAAVGAIQEAVAEALGIPDLSTEGAVEAAVAAADAERIATNKAFQDAKAAYEACLAIDLPEMTQAEMDAAQQALDAWDLCWRNRQCRVVFQ